MPLGLRQHAILGTAKPAIEAPISLYSHGILRAPNQINGSWMAITNGRPTFTAQTSFREAGGKLGAATCLVFPYDEQVWKAIDDVEGARNGSSAPARIGRRIYMLLSEGNRASEENIHSILNIVFTQMSPLNASASAGKEVPRTDDALPTWPAAVQGQLQIFRDSLYMYVQAEQVWLNLALSKLQQLITEILDSGSVYPQLRIVGYGAMIQGQTGPTFLKDTRPGHKIKYLDKSMAQFGLEFNPFERGAQRDQCMLMTMLAYKLRDIIRIPNYEWADYMALTEVLMFEFFGTGTESFGRPYDIADILERVASFIGMGLTEADSYLPEPTDTASWEEWIEFGILFGLIGSRIKAWQAPVVIRLVTGSIYTAAEYLNYVFQADYSRSRSGTFAGIATAPPSTGWSGSLMTPWFPMWRNRPKDDFPFPCATDEDALPCLYEPITPGVAEFQTIESRMGYIATPLAAYELKEVHVRVVSHVDTIHFLANYKMRNIMYWQLPVEQIVADEGLDRRARNYLTLVGLLTGNMNNLSEGYAIRMPPGLAVPMIIDTSVNQFREAVADKTRSGESDAVLPQESTPGAVPTSAPTTESRGPGQPVQQQSPTPVIPEHVGPSAKVGTGNGSDSGQNTGNKAS